MGNQLEIGGLDTITPGISGENATFKGSFSAPYYRWYPYLEGFSPEFVRGILHQFMGEAERIIDPFAGTAVTGFVVAEEGRRSFICDLNPVMQILFKARYCARKLGEGRRQITADFLREFGSKLQHSINGASRDPQLSTSFERCFGDKRYFSDANFDKVLRFRSLVDNIAVPDALVRQLLEVAGLSGLLPASRLKRAGDVRYKTEKELAEGIPGFVEVVQKKLEEICLDLETVVPKLEGRTEIVCGNAADLGRMPSLRCDGLITSPPYVNGTNYFRNTRLELWFSRCVSVPSDLRWFRDRAVTAGINGVTRASEREPPSESVAEVVRSLKEGAYDRRIPAMVAAYFAELTDLFNILGQHLRERAVVAIDIGDSVYAGVHVPADKLLTECLVQVGYEPICSVTLRTRHSNSGEKLKQVLLVLQWSKESSSQEQMIASSVPGWKMGWADFKKQLPHQQKPYSKRSWGSYLHSLCSYPGKLKPAIAHHLVRIFSDPDSCILDPFAGVGTIPFEATLNSRKSFGFELSPAAYAVAQAKVNFPTALRGVKNVLAGLREHVRNYPPSEEELRETVIFGLNGKIADYYHEETLREVLAARAFFRRQDVSKPAVALVMACCLHILHGNRPYALSRRSHPLTSYSPSGKFAYRPLMPRLTRKLERSAKQWQGNGVGLWTDGDRLTEGTIYLRDATEFWPTEVDDLDAVITSPPFFDSTRFHTQNWLRLWFAGWTPKDFKNKPTLFVDERQKDSFRVYEAIFRQAKERLKKDGVVVLHLGKSKKCDMATRILKIADRWFGRYETFDESVEHCESHGIKDKGTTTSHQYLVLY